MPYVAGPNRSGYNVALGDDELAGISLKGITRGIGKAVKTVSKPFAKIERAVLRPAFSIAKNLPVVGGMLKTAEAVQVQVKRAVNAGQAVQRVASSTIAAQKPAPPSVAVFSPAPMQPQAPIGGGNALPGWQSRRGTKRDGTAGQLRRIAAASSPGLTPAPAGAMPVLKADKPSLTSPTVQRLKRGADAAGQVRAAGRRGRSLADRAGGAIDKLAAKATDLAARADKVAEAGDAIGAAQLRDAAAAAATMARNVAVAGGEAAADARMVGGAVQGAADGAVYGAAAAGVRESFMDNKTVLIAGAAGLGLLLLASRNNSAPRDYR